MRGPYARMAESLHELWMFAMNENHNEKLTEPRKYEQSGLYPETGKPFRLWALLGWLTLLIAVLAGAAALLNILLLP